MKNEFVNELAYEAWKEAIEVTEEAMFGAQGEQHRKPCVPNERKRDDRSAMNTMRGYREENLYRNKLRPGPVERQRRW